MNAVMQKLRDLVSGTFREKSVSSRRETALFEVTRTCFAGICSPDHPSEHPIRTKLEPGMWTFWRYDFDSAGNTVRPVSEDIFTSRAEAELRLAASGYGIGRRLGSGSNSVEWELVEL